MMTNEKLGEALSLLADLSPEARVEMIRTSEYAEELFMGYYFPHYIKCPFAPFHFEMFQDWRDLQSGKIRELAWIMFRESAKRQPLYSKVFTPNGVTTIGELSVGDFVIGSDGKKTKVEFLSEIVKRPTFKLTLEDGSSTECDGDHLWTVRRQCRVLNKKHKYKTLSTKELIDSGLFYTRKPDYRNNKNEGRTYLDYKFSIEKVKPVEFEKRELKVDPYFLGVWLGDGTTENVSVSNPEIEIEKYLEEYADKLGLSLKSVNQRGCKKLSITGRKGVDREISLTKMLREIGVLGNKHIPDDYLYSSIEDRRCLLEGLMDTDGTVDGTPSFTNTNENIVDGVIHLVRSLGGRAVKSEQTNSFTYKGEKKKGKKSYRVSICFTDYIPFRVKRKYNKVKLSKTNFSRIVSIEPIGETLGRCIKVENENGLYVTDDFILTHNTSLAKILMTKMLCFKERGYVNIDSYDKNNSETFLYDIAQNLLTNRRIIRDFGYIYQKKRSQEEMTMTRIGKFITKNDVLVEAHSVAESVRGRLYGAQRPDFVCGDDFETNKTKDSEAYTAVTKGHFEEFATGLDSRAGILYLGNYITKTGIVQWIMDRAKSDDKIRVRMVPIEEAGKPTWEAKYCMTDKEAEETNKISLESKKKQFDFVVYQTEMMNNPIGSDQQIFKKEMFKYISYDEVMKMNCRVFMTIDTAISQKTSADYTGISLIFVDREGFWNVMTFKRKMTPKQLLDFIFEYWEKYHIEEVGIEKTTFQMALKEFFEEEMRKRGKFPRIVDLLHRQQKKEERIRGALLGRYESGSIRHITNYIEGLEEELLAFPMSKNDDVCLTSHTLVATINGLKKISLIRKGDLVWTRKGLKKVLWSGKTGKKKVITKFGLSGTPNHPVWTENRGWIKLQSLKASDVLVFLENRLNGMEKNIIDTQNQNGDSSEYTSIPIQNFVNHRHHSIETFGNFLMEKLKSACTSITKMGLMTIGYLHSKSQHLLNMEENIGSQLKNSQEGSDGRRNLLQIHKKLLKDEIKKLQKENKKNLMRGMREIKLFSHIFRAKDVALFFETPHGEKSTIVSPAERKKDTFLDTYRLKNIQRGTAHTAVDISKTTAVMLNSVERIANTKEFCVDNGSVVDVYNIDVEDEHEYFANGILVHNCDSLSYGDQIAKSPFGEVKLVAKTYKPENCS